MTAHPELFDGNSDERFGDGLARARRMIMDRRRVIVRPATSADLPAIRGLLLEASAQPFYQDWFGVDPAAIDRYVPAVQRDGGVFVAEHEGQAVGVSGFWALEHPFSGEPYLEEMAWYLQPAYRRSRANRDLFESVLTLARELGISLIKTTAPAGLPSVGRFYERRGFVPLATEYVLRV